ncbi:ABC transporter permease [Elstera cyanobacteriorum]|uniref:ABC transporter permease n=1 Tax=Elstera cyanobacteriorum TaxID=2022747 RepID=UPI002356E231|nr:ABC transporter permease [Elstera cyanobacteriorum]MCK6444208.1 ABC transporter permease [Elstera cyanobacteriorum]
MTSLKLAPLPPSSFTWGLRLMRRWELLLAVLLVLVMAGNSLLSPYFLDPYNLADATANFTEKAMIALPMALLIIVREIDISVASIMALASLLIGLAAEAGVGTPGLVAIGLLTGLAAGLLNGALVAGLGLPSIVVTIGTLSLFRGITSVVLGDRAITAYPEAFTDLAALKVIPFVSLEFALFLALAAVFALVLHGTVIGRRLYAIGLNPIAARFSGLNVARTKLVLFALTGLVAGLAAVFLTARIGSTRPNIASGWELEIITMVILGGVSIAGGAGTIGGVVLAVFLLGMAGFGMGLLNVPGIVMSTLIGALLLVAVAVPQLAARLRRKGKA